MLLRLLNIPINLFFIQLIKQISMATRCDYMSPEMILSVVFTTDKQCARNHMKYNGYKIECLTKLKSMVKVHAKKSGFGRNEKVLLRFSEMAAQRGGELKGSYKKVNARS